MVQYIFKYQIITRTILLLFLAGMVRTEDRKRINVAYGKDAEQIMDIYAPEDRNLRQRKIIVAIHGGGWAGGSKEHMQELVDFFRAEFSDVYVANMNYRLGSPASPGYPKQLQDIKLALDFLESDLKVKNPEFALIGISAGAHLSMLFAYAFDKEDLVKTVINLVGPTDFTDPYYAQPVGNIALSPLIGPTLYLQNPGLYKEVSPVTYVSSTSAPTICFYGVRDPIVPISQGERIKEKLENAEVVHKYYTYPGAHYIDWSVDEKKSVNSRAARFLRRNFF